MIKVERGKETGRCIVEAHGPRIEILSEIKTLTYWLIKRHGFMASDILLMYAEAMNEIAKEKGEEETDNE